MERWRGKTGVNAPKLFFFLSLAILLGAFVAGRAAASDLPLGSDLDGSELSGGMAMHIADNLPRTKLERPVLLIVRVVQWRLWNKVYKRDLFRLDDSSNVTVLRMTCRAYRISFRGRSRFEDTKKRVRDCRQRADAYRVKKGLSDIMDVVYEVMEKHVNRLLRFADVEAPGFSGSPPTVVDTIDHARRGPTRIFYFCQKTTPWDKKSSKCLGASDMNFRMEFLPQYELEKRTISAGDLKDDDPEADDLTWDYSYTSQREEWPGTTEKSGKRELWLLKPLKPIFEEEGDEKMSPNILFVNLVEDASNKWWSTVKTQRAAGGGKIMTVTCNTDIIPGLPSLERKEKWRTMKEFTGVDVNHANWCISKAAMGFQDKATDVYVASSELATLQALFRQFSEKEKDGKVYKCILKETGADPKLSANLDAALWATYRPVLKKPWRVVKTQQGRGVNVTHCIGYFEIEFSAELWSLSTDEREVWKSRDGLTRLDFTGDRPEIYRGGADNSREELKVEGGQAIVLQKNVVKLSLPLRDEIRIVPSESFEICERSLGILATENDIVRLEIFPDTTEYDIRSTQIFEPQIFKRSAGAISDV